MEKFKVGRIEAFLFISGVVAITTLLFLLNVQEYCFLPLPIYMSILLSTMVTILIWVGCRVIVKYLWDKYPWEKYPKKHLLIELIVIPLWAFCVMFFSRLIYNQLFSGKVEEKEWSNGLVIGLLITLLVTSVHEGVYFYKQWKENFRLSEKLKKAHYEARYETLKAQLNPHFLFNSLNTLISYVDDNQIASNYVQNLSDFLRYVLKNRDKELILIREEIDACSKYMFLQSARFGDSLEWNIQLNEHVLNYFIAPLTIQMLLENAVKHNIISKEKKLNIYITQEKDDFILVENNLQRKSSERSTGIGLKNIFERYEYFTIEKPRIEENEEIFRVVIPIIKSEV